MYLQWYLELLRESRGIPQREKMKNNFQFESILKNAKGDNKAFPKLGERSNVTKSKKSVDWQLKKELIILYMAEGKIPETQ